MPFQKSKDLSGYNYIYLSPADENLEQLRDMDDDDDDFDDFDDYSEDIDELIAAEDNEPTEGDSTELERMRPVARMFVRVGRAQFQDWEH